MLRLFIHCQAGKLIWKFFSKAIIIYVTLNCREQATSTLLNAVIFFWLAVSWFLNFKQTDSQQHQQQQDQLPLTRLTCPPQNIRFPFQQNFIIQCPPLSRITRCQHKNDNNKCMNDSCFVYSLAQKDQQFLVLILFSMIRLSGGSCMAQFKG